MPITPTIQIDTREQLPLDFTQYGIATELETLPVGDYGIRGFSGAHRDDLTLFIVERKSIADLCQSLGNDRSRFFRELRRMRAYNFRGLVIEGFEETIENHRYRSRMSPASVFGSLIRLEVSFGIVIKFCGHPGGAADQVHTWVRYFWQEQIKQHKRLIKIGV